MLPNFKNIVKRVFNSFGFELSNLKRFKQLVQLNTANEFKIAELKIQIDRNNYILCKNTFANKQQLEILGLFDSRKIGSNSNAQLAQDLFVLEFLKRKENGFFIEFGAADGYNLSNTYLLETEYGWKGIVAEPAKIWHEKLIKNRKCIIEKRCIWSETGELVTFNETNEAALSTIEFFTDLDYNSGNRKNKITYPVETISLVDLLDENNAPKDIDYLSIDTEGSEFKILEALDFSKYQIKIITVEHNFSSARNDLFNLLSLNGYIKVFESISLFEDWYVKNNVYSDYLSSRECLFEEAV